MGRPKIVGRYIHTEITIEVGRRIFDRTRHGGAVLARRTGIGHGQLWRQFFERGVEPDVLLIAAEELEEQAIQALQDARLLRQEAKKDPADNVPQSGLYSLRSAS